MRRNRMLWLAVLAVLAALAAPAAAQANEVTKWNEIAQNTILAQPPITSAPPASVTFIAMVQGAVYDAVNSIDQTHRPYLLTRKFDQLASQEAAAATAAFRVLTLTFPEQLPNLQPLYEESLADVPAGPAKEEGIAAGIAAADAMLAQGHDRRQVLPCVWGTDPGDWRPLLAADGSPLCDPSPWIAYGLPFLLESPSQFRTDGPNELASAAYAEDFNEVKELGALDSTTRTPEQTHTAVFVNSHPAPIWNGVARRLADDPSRQLDLADTARLFAMLDLTAADAGINCWNDKYYWGFWRPITAIHEAYRDGNPATEADPNWQPLFVPTLDPAIAGAGPALITPPYPDHPAGAVCQGSSNLHALRAFFGTDKMRFYITSSRFPGERRYFNRFSDPIPLLIDARVWAGIHFRTADVQAAVLGKKVARYMQNHYFQPLG
ncbi:MAG TPA: vanadium-dependent haloperoxidase [Gaiellaceae bacterium]|nr:vanadium-dependent haloperoxidase [Gaiellaceae bacterium]